MAKQERSVEDLLLRAQDEVIQLKKALRSHEEQSKLLNARLLRATKDASRAHASDEDKGAAARAAAEMEEKAAQLQEENTRLVTENTALKRKIELLRQQEKKKPRGSVVRPLSARTPAASPAPRFGQSVLEDTRRQLEETQRELEECRAQLQLSTEAGEQAEHLASERAATIGALQAQLAAAEAEAQDLRDAAQAAEEGARTRGVAGDMDALRARRALLERTSELTALQARHDGQVRRVEELTARLAAAAKESSEADAARRQALARVHQLEAAQAGDALGAAVLRQRDAQIEALTAERAALQAHCTALADAAKDADRERAHQEREASLTARIAQLDAAAAADRTEIASLLAKLSAECEQHAATKADRRDLHRRCLQLQEAHDTLAARLAYFSKHSSVDPADVEAALVLVAERKANAAPPAPADAVATLERQLRSLQSVHAQTLLDLDRVHTVLAERERALGSATLHTAQQQRLADAALHEHQLRIDELARLADERAARITRLEGQLRSLAYGSQARKTTFEAEAGPATPSAPLSISSMPTPSLAPPVASTSATAAPAAAPSTGLITEPVLRSDQTLFEVTIESVHLTPAGAGLCAGPGGPRTFVTYDFYTHDTSATAVGAGTVAAYGHVAQFVVTVDAALAAYLRGGGMLVELHHARGTDFRTIAAATVRMHGLLADPAGATRGLRGHTSLLAIGDPTVVVAELHYCLRFVRPIEQALAALQLREAAQALLAGDGDTVVDERATGQGSTRGAGTESSAGEGLRVTVAACHGLAGQPSAFVAYRLLDHPDTVTPTVPRCPSPRFHTTSVFPAPAQLAALEDAVVDFFVFDDDDPDSSSYLSTAAVSLAPLAARQPVRGAFPLRRPDGRTAGAIDLAIEWLDEAGATVAPVFAPSPAAISPAPLNVPTSAAALAPAAPTPAPVSAPLPAPASGFPAEPPPDPRVPSGPLASSAVANASGPAASIGSLSTSMESHDDVVHEGRTRRTRGAAPDPAFIAVHGLLLSAMPPCARVFVSFELLGVDPERLESLAATLAPSPAAPAAAAFTFLREFHFDGRADGGLDSPVVAVPAGKDALKDLAKQLKTNKTCLLNFDVVSEPDGGDCDTLGTATVDLYRLLQEGADLVETAVPVQREGQVLGSLTVSVRFVAALRFYFKKK
eukprot:m.152482 g.152482  ORF g.152482 m.152482 type:complete len:1155 (-) comp15106_c0_seq9:76-3540(-)